MRERTARKRSYGENLVEHVRGSAGRNKLKGETEGKENGRGGKRESVGKQS